jgi:hypothetical protein
VIPGGGGGQAMVCGWFDCDCSGASGTARWHYAECALLNAPPAAPFAA